VFNETTASTSRGVVDGSLLTTDLLGCAWSAWRCGHSTPGAISLVGWLNRRGYSGVWNRKISCTYRESNTDFSARPVPSPVL